MRAWTRKLYTVQEVGFDYDLHAFDIINKIGDVIANIVPSTIEDMDYIIECLNGGEDVDGWEDGMGNTIRVPKSEKNNLGKLHGELNQLKEKYDALKRNINIEKAGGDLARLCNLNTEFDETFDVFFDQDQLRKKYDSWDTEEDCPLITLSNDEMLSLLDEQDLQSYINFFKSYFDELEAELDNLKSDNPYEPSL